MIRLVVSARARTDVRELLAWSQDQFGREARGRYRRLIQQAYDDLRADPERIGVRSSADIPEGLRLYHVKHSRMRPHRSDRISTPRHFIVFRRKGEIVEIIRVLHDAMDLARHL